jgi:DNA-binding MarR family transcriptional regulator
MDSLSDADMDLWHAWKVAADTVRARIVDDVARATGLSDPDFGVLTRVGEEGGGRLRQSELAASMNWHRSRLSHHLTRMEQRGLVVRSPAGAGVDVIITAAGRVAVAGARPVHAAAVRQHLVDLIPDSSRHELRQVLTSLGAPEPATTR